MGLANRRGWFVDEAAHWSCAGPASDPAVSVCAEASACFVYGRAAPWTR